MILHLPLNKTRMPMNCNEFLECSKTRRLWSIKTNSVSYHIRSYLSIVASCLSPNHCFFSLLRIILNYCQLAQAMLHGFTYNKNGGRITRNYVSYLMSTLHSLVLSFVTTTDALDS